MRCDVLVIGCGVIGATVAYELASAGLSVVGIDALHPGSGASGAALGVLTGVSSQQPTGAVADLRLKSWALFEPLIARLQEDLGRSLPVNRRGIVIGLTEPEDPERWASTLAARQAAGYRLQWLDPTALAELQPGLRSDLLGGIFSPDDRQLDPRLLTQFLVQAAQQQGAQFFFNTPVTDFKLGEFKLGSQRVNAVYTDGVTVSPGMVVVAAGLGSQGIGSRLGLEIPMQSVKGQAVQIFAPQMRWGPVLTWNDLHLVPVGDGSVWVGATVEFEFAAPQPTVNGIRDLLQRATDLCPGLAAGEFRHSWAGMRPRPCGQRAPILGFSPLHQNVIVATGHYRNGVLLAPITGVVVRDLVMGANSLEMDLTAFALKPLPPT